MFLERREVSLTLLRTQLDMAYSRAVRVMDALNERGWIQKPGPSAPWDITVEVQDLQEITA